MIAHFDRGELVRPLAPGQYQGVAGRVHLPGDALSYPSGDEFRDADGLASIAKQLATGSIPITIGHPASMPAREDPYVRIVGRIVGARVDGDHAIATMNITDRAAIALIAGGVRELSLGYSVATLDARRYQRGIKLDHLAIVERARCGSACAISPRADGVHMCECSATRRDEPDPEAAAKARMIARTRVAYLSPSTTNTIAPPATGTGTPSGGEPDPEAAAMARMKLATASRWKTVR